MTGLLTEKNWVSKFGKEQGYKSGVYHLRIGMKSRSRLLSDSGAALWFVAYLSYLAGFSRNPFPVSSPSRSIYIIFGFKLLMVQLCGSTRAQYWQQ